jgi:hypothetical protein
LRIDEEGAGGPMTGWKIEAAFPPGQLVIKATCSLDRVDAGLAPDLGAQSWRPMLQALNRRNTSS